MTTLLHVAMYTESKSLNEGNIESPRTQIHEVQTLHYENILRGLFRLFAVIRIQKKKKYIIVVSKCVI